MSHLVLKLPFSLLHIAFEAMLEISGLGFFLLFIASSFQTDAFKPLSHHHYFTYFLVPLVAANLIAEDFSMMV
ncbi:hypothetical protein J3R82DRAFT_11291 [Butyriboletus roseoflavus]|nr:hypothetical protein J3R82DRAFT_11291 [Butyriboletus roseoflavus]